MNKNLNKIMALFLTGCLVTGLTACGSTSKPGETESAAVKETELKKVTILTFNPADEKAKALLDSQKALFEKMYPDISLEITTGDVQVESGKLTTMLNSGINLPDIININAGPSRVGMLAETGTIKPLDDLYEKNGWKEKVNPAALELCSYVDGKLYEVPNTMDSISCYYNKEIFKELNLEIPKTWEEFIQICEATKAAGYEPLTVGARDGYAVGWLFGNILQSTVGTENARKLCYSESKWTDPEAVKAIALFDELVKKEYISSVSSTRGEADALYAFLNGQAAMYFIGSWSISSIYDSNMQDKISTFALPSQVGEKPYATSGLGNSWIIPAGIQNTAGAEKWIEFILSDEYAQMMAADESNNSIYTSKAFVNVAVKTPLLQTAKDAISEGAGRNPSVFIGTETKNAYFQNLQGLIAGLGTPEEAAENIQEGQNKDLQTSK